MLPRFAHLEPKPLRAAFDHPEWLFELKYDGYRAMLYLEGGKVTLVSKTGHVYTRFGDLCAELAGEIERRELILDGEIACLDGEGRPQFNQLFYNRGRPVFVVYDLLWLNGVDYRQRPLLFRKATLATSIPGASECILEAQHVLERGVDFFNVVCDRNLEGIVAKWGQSSYATLHGRVPWVKIRNPAYTQMEGRREKFERFRERT